VNRRSPWFYVYVVVSSAVVVALLTWLLEDEVNWGYTVFITAAVLVGVILGNVIRSRRS